MFLNFHYILHIISQERLNVDALRCNLILLQNALCTKVPPKGVVNLVRKCLIYKSCLE